MKDSNNGGFCYIAKAEENYERAVEAQEDRSKVKTWQPVINACWIKQKS